MDELTIAVYRELIDDYEALLKLKKWLRPSQYEDVAESIRREIVELVKEEEKWRTQEQ